MIAHLWRRMLCEVLDRHRLDRCVNEHEWVWVETAEGGSWQVKPQSVARRETRRGGHRAR